MAGLIYNSSGVKSPCNLSIAATKLCVSNVVLDLEPEVGMENNPDLVFNNKKNMAC